METLFRQEVSVEPLDQTQCFRVWGNISDGFTLPVCGMTKSVVYACIPPSHCFVNQVLLSAATSVLPVVRTLSANN